MIMFIESTIKAKNVRHWRGCIVDFSQLISNPSSVKRATVLYCTVKDIQ